MTTAAPPASANIANTDQFEYWNGETSEKWVTHRDVLDASLAEMADLLLRAADPRVAERVIDIGCGTGATSRRLAERVAPGGEVVALDLSGPMLELARTEPRENLSFLQADAQSVAFARGAADLASLCFRARGRASLCRAGPPTSRARGRRPRARGRDLALRRDVLRRRDRVAFARGAADLASLCFRARGRRPRVALLSRAGPPTSRRFAFRVALLSRAGPPTTSRPSRFGVMFFASLSRLSRAGPPTSRPRASA